MLLPSFLVYKKGRCRWGLHNPVSANHSFAIFFFFEHVVLLNCPHSFPCDCRDSFRLFAWTIFVEGSDGRGGKIDGEGGDCEAVWRHVGVLAVGCIGKLSSFSMGGFLFF